MSKSQEVRIVVWDQPEPPTQTEAEARLSQEGYHSFKWYDVPGASYPRHRHAEDECIWILKGELTFSIEGRDLTLKSGDRLYLPARVPHTAAAPKSAGVTYLVGQKKAHPHHD